MKIITLALVSVTLAQTPPTFICAPQSLTAAGPLQCGPPSAFGLIPAPPIPPPTQNNTATFLGVDTTTQGNWQSKYGATQYVVEGVPATLNTPVSITVTGAMPFTWAATTSDVRALTIPVVDPTGKLLPANPAMRIAASIFGTSWNIDFQPASQNPYKVSLYLLDWDGGNGRAETFTVLDGDKGTAMTTGQASNFSPGTYYSWKATGHITIQIKSTGLANAVISGIFIDPAPVISGSDFCMGVPAKFAQNQAVCSIYQQIAMGKRKLP